MKSRAIHRAIKHVSARLSTPSNTATAILTKTVAEHEAYGIFARVVAQKADGSVAACYRIVAAVHRDVGGNVTLDASTTTEAEGAAMTAAVTVDTGTQTFSVKVTGVAAEVYNWYAEAEFIRMIATA